jgi:enterochelin esterase-like enzyme
MTTNRILTLLFSILFGFTGFCTNAQSFGNFIDYLSSVSAADRQSKSDSFISSVKEFPILEDTVAWIIYKGPGKEPSVAGDLTGWAPGKDKMLNIPGTDLWYLKLVAERNARLDYKIVYDGSTWIQDPLNPYTSAGGYGVNSELRMPAYTPPAELNYSAGIPHGTLTDTAFYSSILKNSRDIKIWLPPDYNSSGKPYPLLLVHDGPEYIEFADMLNILDNLGAGKKIDPPVTVFIPPVDRDQEYILFKQDKYTEFIASELIPWLCKEYRITTEPGKRAVLGSSAGGNIVIWLGMKHPELFGNIAAFSPLVEKDILKTFSGSERMNLKLYILNGKYDHLDIIQESVKSFIPILSDKKYEFKFVEYPDSHSYAFWKGHIPDALEYFFPY